MRNLLFALIAIVMGAFVFAGGSPASAMSAGAVTGMSDVVKGDSAVEDVAWVRNCYWRYGHRHCRSSWRPGWGFWRHRHHNRHCWWRHGRRICRY